MKAVCGNTKDTICDTCPLKELSREQLGAAHHLMSTTAEWHRKLDVNLLTDEELIDILADEASLKANYTELLFETSDVIIGAMRQTASTKCTRASGPPPTVTRV